jgi:phage-related protein
MRPLSLAGTRHVRDIASSEPMLILLRVHPNPNDSAETLYLALNSEDVVYPKTGGQTYLAFNFDLEDIYDDSTGALKELRLTVCNVGRMLQSYLEDYAGAVGATVEIVVISMMDQDGDPLQQFEFSIVGTQADAQVVTFTLGADSPLRRKFPKHVYRKDYCMWITAGGYKGPNCKYAGALPTCDGTLNGANGCKAHGNTLNFGAFPMIDTKGIWTSSAQ